MGEPETKFDGQGRAYIDPADLLKSPKVQQQYAAAKRVVGQQADAVTRRADLPRRLSDAEAEVPYRIICQGDKPDLVTYHQMDTLGMALAFGAELACLPRTAYVIVQGGELPGNGLKISKR